MFPQRYGAQFPRDFAPIVRNILKRLFRVYGHIYHSHFRCSTGFGAIALLERAGGRRRWAAGGKGC